MTATPEELRSRFQAALRARVPVHAEQMRWDKRRLLVHQERQLRRLLGHAMEHSPFHARRLAGIDPESFELDSLSYLPVMTKNEMMEAYGDVVTDRRLTRERVQEYLAATGQNPEMLDDEYFAISTGGSSGLKGAFVYDWDGMVDFASRMIAYGDEARPGMAVAFVLAPSAAHSSGLVASLFKGSPIDLTYIPATLPLKQIVTRLNECQPESLMSYASILNLLAEEQLAGRLSIRPARIRAAAEQLEPEVEARISEAFGTPISSMFASSEGLFGVRRPGEAAFTFATDLTIVELVDERYEPAPPDTPSAAVLVTNLFNMAQPLIRYVLEDRFTRCPDASGHGHLVATVQGRSMETFAYGNRNVHPLTVLASVIEAPAVADYQIRQTEGGVDADVMVRGTLDRAGLEADLQRALAEAGLPDPRVSVRIVDRLERDPHTGKVRRLLPLELPAAASGGRP